jgi:alpha-D-xyloside xylohydrolase
LGRFADGAAKPGLRATYFSWGFREVTGREITATLDWSGSPGGGRAQFYGCHYEGFLVAPEEGEYELSLESDEGARLHLDCKLAIEHWGAHTLAEKSARVRLAAGPHPLKIEYYQVLGGAGLHFRWTPPGGRKALVPAWALEHEPKER